MAKVIILYPSIFKCYEKFARKVLKITQNIEDLSFSCPEDPNGFINRIIKEELKNARVCINADWKSSEITHAIIFNDGEEFVEESEYFQLNKIPLRHIKIAITRVINIKNEPKYKSLKSTPTYEYIGRGSYWGNPYSMYEAGDDRDEVIRKFKYDFDHEKFPNKEKKEVYKLAGKKLGCFCKPQACHGDVLADFLNSWDDGK